MTKQNQAPALASAEDVQRLENVFADTSATPRTRAWMLQKAALGVAAAGLAGVAAGCGGSSRKTTSTAASTMSHGDTIKSVIDTAITAEALAVTYLSAVIKATKPSDKTGPFVSVLKAANSAEYDHYKALQSLGAKPLTLKFWAPNAFFGPKLSGVFPTLEVAETLFVNAYLIGTTVFAKAGKADFARYAGEIGGVEAEHLALARAAQQKIPNDLGFMDYSIDSMDGIVKALESAGVGFGKQGSKPGTFVHFTAPTSDVLTPVSNGGPA
ncbi:MAG TPA: hypothetical protein VGH79_06040 [Gaiellaceae bacterium]|jgi:hypothetical protein